MAERKGIYFVADVHLGLETGDPAERENRFVSFLKALPRKSTKALYLLGDIWDFWYEYHDVVPRTGTRVIAQLINLMDAGVEVFFFEGNHDIWSYSYFQSLGMKKLFQPSVIDIGGKIFCLGHGDGLGGAKWNYSLMLKVFHNKVAQSLFSTLHPWLAYRFGLNWSNSNRRCHKPYHFRGAEEPLFRFAESQLKRCKVDYFVFGHFHDSVDIEVKDGSRLYVVKDWMQGGSPNLYYEVGSNCAPHFEGLPSL